MNEDQHLHGMSIVNSIFNILRFNRKNWKAVVLCLFAATVFWFFNALNKNYTTNISFPLAFDYSRENYIAVRPLPNEVKINVTGMGWDLFRRSLGVKVPPLIITLEQPTKIKKIAGSSLPALFANQLERFEINFILTDTLQVSLEPKAKRWITLQLDSPAILFKKGYTKTSEARIVPDSIFVEGPWQLITSLQEPVALKLSQRNIDENFNEDIEVRFLNNELIKRDPPTVNISFNVDELLTVSDSIELKIVNYPQGANPFYGIKNLPVTFSIPQRFMDQYVRDSIKAVVDLRDFTRGTKKFMPQVQGLPPYSSVVTIDSIFVQF